MSEPGLPIRTVSDAEIRAARPPRNDLDDQVPYAFFVEPERTAAGNVEDVATILVTNRECPFHCLMCDLWKNTTLETVPLGSIPAQIDHALDRLSPAKHVKLYNAGSFFDPHAIPPDDYPAIIQRLARFETVIVENHPRFCTERVSRFREKLGTQLEVAVGLETAHPQVLAALNKQMTLEDFRRAAQFLQEHDVASRTFILLRPPYLSEEAGVEWALKSVEAAFDAGTGCCTIIPVREGNGVMEQLRDQGLFTPPSLHSMERTLQTAVGMGRGRVFVDLWDAKRFAQCPACADQRIERLRAINFTQQIPPRIDCHCGGSP